MTPYLTDVAMHAGLGVMFTCTAECTRRICKHRARQIALGSVLILTEAAITVPLVG